MINSYLTEQQLDSRKVFSGNLLHVYKDTVSLPNGKSSTREYIKHLGAVCIVALTEDNRVIVEKQYRYPMREVTIEIPAGKLDSKDEDPYQAALRELKEETGAEARELTSLGVYYGIPAYSDEVVHIFLAKGLTFGETSLDEDEFLTWELVPIRELADDICAGKVPDGKTQAAILRVCRMLNL